MSNADTKIKEMLEVIEDICRYNEEVTMYEVMTLRDIGWTLKSLQDMNDGIKEALL